MSRIDKSRIGMFDAARAICMLWIIGLWHMTSYLKSDCNLSKSAAANAVTYGVLATFLFISAFFLGNRRVRSFRDALDFWVKRAIRIYPLFFLSCTTLLIINHYWGYDYINGVKQYVLTLLGFSCIFTTAPQTVWFISMLLLFYAVTPLINRFTGWIIRIAISSCILLVFYMLKAFGFEIDARLLHLFPFYAAGLISAGRVKINERLQIYVLLPAIIIFVGGVYYLSYTKNNLFQYITIAAFIMLTLETGKLLVKSVVLRKLMEFISYASMTAYLFHRQLFGAIQYIFGKFSLTFAYICVLPALLIVSYYVQLFYDKVITYTQTKQDTIIHRGK